MSSNSFRKEFLDPSGRAKSPTRPLDAIEPIVDSAAITRLIDSLNYPPLDSPHPRQLYKQPAPRTQRKRVTNKSGSSQGSRRAAPKTSRHSHNNSAGSHVSFQQPPPLSPIDTLASVAIQEAQSPQFNNHALFYSPPRGGHRVQMSPVTNSYPAPIWGNAQYGEYTMGMEERPSKRARSEFLPSPHQQGSPMFGQGVTRPATSYASSFGFAQNLEQSIDNGHRSNGFPHPTNIQYGQRNTVGEQPRMDDAELLLNLFNGSPRLAQAESKPVHKTNKATPTIPPFPYGAPDPAPISNHSHAPIPRAEPIEDHTVHRPGKEPVALGIDIYTNPSAQTHTPPDEFFVTNNQSEEASLPPEKRLDSHGSFLQEAVNITGEKVNDEASAPAGPSHTIRDIMQTNTAQPKQLQSPQSLLAEPKEYPPSPQTTDPVIPPDHARQTEWLSTLKNRRSSESHIAFAGNQEALNRDGRPSSVPIDTPVADAPSEALTRDIAQTQAPSTSLTDQSTRCAGCKWAPNSTSGDRVDWLNCDGCQNWYHFACAGFTAKDIRRIDKFYCRACKGKFGNTTFVRKSTRVTTTVDYAGLNEGVLRQSDDHPEHHYIEPIKNGSIPLVPETFPRMRAEDITAEFFEKSMSFCEPILIPADLNPRPDYPGSVPNSLTSRPMDPKLPGFYDSSAAEEEYELVRDDGQDKLDMVIPQGLTVRRVAELYGPENHVPVIDVKSQESDTNKKWTVGKWADYYESTGDKVIRNVISLEVSKTPFGRLIRRPKVVRDLDLQDSVWPRNETRKSVGFYCLMSVADSYTDFHIDFGGSSVYYHILKGKKVFFFIPPTKSNLQKYEDWNTLPSQNWTWLPDQTKTKECYRVDLYPGDTMLIPSGWIHSVWTPEDSLVIGGNFLTRLHYGMQFRIAEIEKNNKTGIAFRYPKFQKVMWYTIIKYVEEDPLPASVRDLFNQGQQFKRAVPSWTQFNKFGHNSDLGPENYHARYYPKTELEGLPDMVSYIFRTVLIHLDCLEGITAATRKAVSDSIPKHVEPLGVARSFAMWTAWKRGNEDIPQWAHPDSVLPTRSDGDGQKKLSTAQCKRLERAAAIPAPERVSARIKNAIEISTTPKTSTLGPRRTACDACRRRKMRCKHIEASTSGSPVPSDANDSPLPGSSTFLGVVIPSPPIQRLPDPYFQAQYDTPIFRPQNMDLPAPSDVGPSMETNSQLQPETPDGKKGRTKACDECRRSKRRCIHDEHGNIDPVKKNEPIIPRGSAKRKLTSGSEVPSGKKLKKEPSLPGDVSGSFSSGAGQSGMNGTSDMWSNSAASAPSASVSQPAYDTFEMYMEHPAEVYDYNTAGNSSLAGPNGVGRVIDTHDNPPLPISQPQFAGLQAIADAAMADTADSVLDPALFDLSVPKIPTESAQIVDAQALPEEPSTAPQELALVDDPIDIDSSSRKTRTQVDAPVTIEERLLEEVAHFVADEDETIVEEIDRSEAVEPLVESTALVKQAQPHSKASQPVASEVELAETPALEDQCPEADIKDSRAAETEKVDLIQQPPSTSPLSEPQTPVVITAEIDEVDLVQPIVEHIAHEPSVSSEISAADPIPRLEHTTVVSQPSPTLQEEAPTASIEHPFSRESSGLSDAPSEHLQYGIQPDTDVVAVSEQRQRQSTRQSKAPSGAAPETGEAATPAPSTTVTASKRQSSRHSKPIERLVADQHAELEALSNKKANKKATLPYGYINGKSASPETARVKQTLSKPAAKSPASVKTAIAKTPVKNAVRRKSAKLEVKTEDKLEAAASNSPEVVETEEEINRRIALQIQKEELGLRRRSRGP